MSLSPLQYVGIAIQLCIQVLKRWKQNGGMLTPYEKEQVLLCIEFLTAQLFRCISDLSRELGKFGGEFEVPRVQHGCLEYKCTDAHDQRDSGNPFGEPSFPG